MRGKNNVLSANKQIAYRSFVSIQLPSSVQSDNWWKNALIYSFSADSTEGEELRDRPIGNQNKEMLVKSEKKLEESGKIRTNERFPTV